MSILVRYAPPSMTTAQYEEMKRRLQEAADGPPEGLEMHVCFGEEGRRRVTEVWASLEDLQRRAERLGPIAEAAGIAVQEPQVLPVRNFLLADDPQSPDDTGLVVRWAPRSLSAAQYDEISAKVQEQEQAYPDEGALVHVCMGEEGALQVGEVWRSQAAFDAYFGRLKPLLDAAGISPSEPERFAQHSLIVTDAAPRQVTA